MGSIAVGRLAGAVSEAGGLGLIGGWWPSALPRQRWRVAAFVRGPDKRAEFPAWRRASPDLPR
ncbi:MAG: hypothetical protein ACLQFW_18540 [Xanthobacteraceae bacterium]